MVVIKKQHTKVNFTNIKIPVRFIVIHDTGVLGQTAKNNADYFENTNRGASANFFIDKKEIIEVVAAGIKAWHIGDDRSGDSHDVGDLINNGNTVGIEFCAEKDGTFHPNTIALGVFLVKKLMKDYTLSANKVVRHYDASGKNCPQRMNVDGKWTLWYKYHKQLTGQTVSAVTISGSSSKVTSIKVASGDTLWGISKQYNATVAQLKQWNNLKSDVITIGQNIKLTNTVAVKTTTTTTKKKVTKKFNLPSGVYTLENNKNAYSNSVLIIQQAMASIYYYPNKGAKNNGVDGYFGTKTEDALERFQTVYGLLVDGKYGPSTKAKLDSLVNK